MSSSNVRSIESLETFHRGIVRLSGEWDRTIQEIRMLVHRAEEYFSQEQPAYWNQQIQLAERELTEALDNLQMKRSAARASDRPAATEAVKRVQAAKRRKQLCDEKKQLAKKWALEMGRQCDQLLGPIADVAEQCEVVLPTAAAELRQLIGQLKLYAEQSDSSNQPE